ncbi:hypothetical protein LTS18_004233 [Coniosporium uncinatum]|uniref:Uncharacterized protein n=1 Tax=Coniosporium uncinatum TaxID=93489 RepID=A0ACC3E097_9PEZI|nr:hypothetical protein LTS18_004233 [Coniosporium uncinatum]
MPADRLLGVLLRSLQTHTEQQDTPQLLSTAASLLTSLSNPLNITLLTRELLLAPALWDRPDGLRTCLRFMGVFHSASVTVINRENEQHEEKQPHFQPAGPETGVHIPKEEWIRAVVKGADERSHRWKHLMVLGGLLLGCNNPDHEPLPRPLKRTLEAALVQAANLALEDQRHGDEFAGCCITLVLNHTFGILSDVERAQLNYDQLLPVLIGSAFFSPEGFQSAYFLGAVDLDVVEVPNRKFSWPAKSSSYHQIDRLLQRPLIFSLGPLSRIIAHAVENAQDSWLIRTVIDDLMGFSRSLLTQWRQNKLSEIDASEERLYLDDETTRTTLPSLWKLLKAALFAIVIVLRGAVGRLVSDRSLANDSAAPLLASQVLHTLRNSYFVSTRLGANSFSQYTFVYLTTLDVLSNYPTEAEAFVQGIRPVRLGEIPGHPIDRCLDLYFLNTAEHFTLKLTPSTNETLLIAAATPYLVTGGNQNLAQVFEAAHSVMLSVFSAPQCADIAAKHLPYYVNSLFFSFPHNLSPRQFRLAFKTLLQVTAPPSPLSGSQPELPAILLEMVHHRAQTASTAPLTTGLGSPAPQSHVEADDNLPPLSEQAVLKLTLLDALPFLPLELLEEWLPICADLINTIGDVSAREACKRRFWEILAGGEMDAERSQICVAWWNTRGGRETVLFGREVGKEEYMMSGALNLTETAAKL